MLPTLLIAAGSVSALVGLWPFGPYQLSLLIAGRLHRFPAVPSAKDPSSAAAGERFAICLCAYNEAAIIADKVEDMLRLREAAGGDLDILVYIDGATDDTASRLDAYRDRIDLVIGNGRHGKTHGMNVLVARTGASIVMFTDANVRIDPTAVAVLRRYFADPTIGCVCSHLRYVNAAQSATATIGSAFWAFNEWSKGLETASGSVIGADGSLFATRRRLRREVPKGLFDDIFVSLGVLLAGYRVVRAPELQSFETHATTAADEFRRKVRIACESMHVHFELWPELRRLDPWNLYKYVGHRLLRWIGGYFLLAALLFFIAAAAVEFGPIAVVAAGLIFLSVLTTAWWLRFGPAIKLMNIVLALAGNVVGVRRAFRGKRSVTWEPPQSSRAAMEPAGPTH